jgi:hypothetical protein
MKALYTIALASSALYVAPVFAETVEVEGKVYQYSVDKDRYVVAKQVQEGSLTIDPQGNTPALSKCSVLETAFARVNTILDRCDLSKPDSASCKAAKRAIVGVVGALPEFQNSIAVHPENTPTNVLANEISAKEVRALANHFNTTPEAIIPVDDPGKNTVLDVRYVSTPDSIAGIIDILAPEVRTFPEKVRYDPISKKLTVFGLDAICGLVAQNSVEVKSLAEFQVNSRLESQLEKSRIWPLYSALAKLDVPASDDLSQGIKLGMAVASTLDGYSVKDQFKVGLLAASELFDNGVLLKADSQEQLLAKLKEKSGASASLNLVYNLKLAD